MCDFPVFISVFLRSFSLSLYYFPPPSLSLLSQVPPYFQDAKLIWSNLSLCDGLAGITLGSACKMSRDGVYCWTAASITFGACVILRRVRDRVGGEAMEEGKWTVEDADWVGAYGGRCSVGAVALPQCLASVKLAASRLSVSAASNDSGPLALLDDVKIAVDMLETVVGKIVDAAEGSDWRNMLYRETIVNLTGGHNTPWERSEMEVLSGFLR